MNSQHNLDGKRHRVTYIHTHLNLLRKANIRERFQTFQHLTKRTVNSVASEWQRMAMTIKNVQDLLDPGYLLFAYQLPASRMNGLPVEISLTLITCSPITAAVAEHMKLHAPSLPTYHHPGTTLMCTCGLFALVRAAAQSCNDAMALPPRHA